MNRLPLFLAFLCAACLPKSAPPPQSVSPRQVELARAKDPGVTDEQLERGRALFVHHCGDCHDHPDLSAQRLSKWPGILKDMIERSELDAARPGGGGDGGTPVASASNAASASADLTTFVMTAAEAAGARP